LEELRAMGVALPASSPVLANAIVAEPSHDSTPAVTQRAVVIDTTPEVTLPPPPVANADEIRMAKAKAVADQTAQAHLAKASNPAPVIRRPIVPVPPVPQPRTYTPMLMMAAAVIVGAIGAAEGARRFGFDWPGRDVRETPPVEMTAAVESVTPPERRAIARNTPPAASVVPETKAVTANRASVTPSRSAAARPKAGTAAGQRAPIRQATPSAQQVVPAVARAASPEIPASAPTRAPAAESARPAAPPAGKFFESNDVDEAPRVASRVAPRLPANLPAGADKKIVIARVLVSRTGHPYQVTLLRGSMLGRASDEAVVAAVTQWTFSPARKKGEPVNCWYNIGIPLGQAD
jgi:hypothetical protein